MAKEFLIMLQSIIKTIPSMLYSIVLLALFYWQFNDQYALLINRFSDAKLSVLYGYLFIYLFGTFMLMTTLVNLIHAMIHQKAFVIITLLTLVIFYALSLENFAHIIQYFIHYPFDTYTIMGMIFFMLLSFVYALYSMGILYFKTAIPWSHLLIFVVLGLLFVLYFITQHG